MTETTYFGIDLGTTNSAIAYLDAAGVATLVPNHDTDGEITPSVVYIDADSGPVVGQAAIDVAPLYPDRVVSLVKRHMGKPREWLIDEQAYTPESLSAIILKRLTNHAAAHVGGDVSKAVITVPAYFGMLERGATQNAGRIAGFDEVGIVPEPVAAALHYDVVAGATDRTILVYDLGGGTFDTTVIGITENSIDVLVTDGDSQLGGTDWDKRLVQVIVERLSAEVDFGDDDPADDEQFMAELRAIAESTKKGLSRAAKRPVAPRLGQKGARFDITRDEFETATSDLLESTIDYTQRTLDKLSEKYPDRNVDQIILVGGSTRMPAVARRLEEEFGLTPLLHDPDKAVAKGAARYAISRAAWDWEETTELSGDEREQRLLERTQELSQYTGLSEDTIRSIARKKVTTVLPKSFGVKLVDTDSPHFPDDLEAASYIEHLVHANDPLPSGPHIEKAQTVAPYQTAVQLEVYEQAGAIERSELEFNTPVDYGTGLLTGFEAKAEPQDFDISMTVDEQGLLSVHAEDVGGDNEVTIEVRINVLSDDQVTTAREHVTSLTVRG